VARSARAAASPATAVLFSCCCSTTSRAASAVVPNFAGGRLQQSAVVDPWELCPGTACLYMG
jgi:hypothetical protein